MKGIYIFGIIICLIILSIVLYLIFKPKEDSVSPNTKEPILKDILTFGSTPGMDYSTSNNVDKSFIMGTFISDVMLSGLSLTFDRDNSIFNTSNVKITIENDGNILYNMTIIDFTVTPIVTQLSNIIINKNSKVLLKLNGINTKILKPSITFNYYTILDSGAISTFPPPSSDKLNTKLWGTMISTNPYVINFPELCPGTTVEYGINIPDINKVSFSISGGGSRSFTCMVGYFRALNRMGYKNKSQYVSSVSGGSWFYGLYAFCQSNPKYTDDILLGKSSGLINEIPDPTKITINSLNTVNKSNTLYNCFNR